MADIDKDDDVDDAAANKNLRRMIKFRVELAKGRERERPLSALPS